MFGLMIWCLVMIGVSSVLLYCGLCCVWMIVLCGLMYMIVYLVLLNVVYSGLIFCVM